VKYLPTRSSKSFAAPSQTEFLELSHVWNCCYVGKKEVVPIIIEGLRRLEYRGYDSAGIAVAGNGDQLQLRRAEGKLRNLEEAIRLKPLEGTYASATLAGPPTAVRRRKCPSSSRLHRQDCRRA